MLNSNHMHTILILYSTNANKIKRKWLSTSAMHTDPLNGKNIVFDVEDYRLKDGTNRLFAKNNIAGNTYNTKDRKKDLIGINKEKICQM
jgi:hypothetical protein